MDATEGLSLPAVPLGELVQFPASIYSTGAQAKPDGQENTYLKRPFIAKGLQLIKEENENNPAPNF